MGQGVRIIMINKTPYPWESKVDPSYQMDEWDESFPKIVQPYSSILVYVEFQKGAIVASDDQGWATFTMKGTREQKGFKLHAVYSDEGEIQVKLVGITPINKPLCTSLGKHRKEYFSEREQLYLNIGIVGNEDDGFVFFNREQDNANWMKFLDGNKKISQFTIPGTHDTLTYGLNEGLIKNLPDGVLTALSESLLGSLSAFLGPLVLLGGITPSIILHATQCQRLNLEQQLNRGVRFFDIRLNVDANKLEAYHGGIRLHINFDEVLSMCYRFLARNPSETILMSVKNESGKDMEYFSRLVLEKTKQQPRWYTQNDFPRLDDVRGKIVLIRRFESKETAGSGIDAYKGWPSNSTEWLNQKTSQQPGTLDIRVQDEYQSYLHSQLDHKFYNYAKPVLKESEADQAEEHLYINFMSGTGGVYPETLANGYMSQYIGTNGKLFSEIANTAHKKYGIIPMDFPETPYEGALITQLILQNELRVAGSFNTELIENRSYFIKPLSNLNKCADLAGGGNETGGDLIIYDSNANENQQWKFEPADGHYYYIKSVKRPNLVLDVKGGERSNGSQVILYPKTQNDNQKWAVDHLGNGRFRFSPKHAPEFALNLYGFDSANTKPLVIYQSGNKDLASIWELLPV